MTTATTFLAPTEAQVGDYKFLAQMVKVTEIEFDFNREDVDVSEEEMETITKDACTEWVVEVDGDETVEEFGELLTEQISDETGWCVEDISWVLISA